jgi:hypothetical protein
MRRAAVVPGLVALAVVVLAIIVLAVPCLAQDSSTGSIHGTVFDPSIRRIAGASVALGNSATGFRYQQTTNGQGQFAFELLPPGEYTARVTSEGMSPQLSQTLHVDIGGVTDIPFQMTLAGARESVTVSAEPKAVETQPRGLSAVIDERAILNLPLNGHRFTDLALLTPGVTQDPRGSNSTSNGDLAFGGIRGFQTSYLVDGADNNNAFFAQARGRYRAPYQFSNEVIQEFRVSPNSVSAESGRSGGAVVSPSPVLINFTAPDSIICETVPSMPAIRSRTSSLPTNSTSPASPSEVRCAAIASFSLPATTSTSFTSLPSSAS